jgi:hypothetical protein
MELVVELVEELNQLEPQQELAMQQERVVVY